MNTGTIPTKQGSMTSSTNHRFPRNACTLSPSCPQHPYHLRLICPLPPLLYQPEYPGTQSESTEKSSLRGIKQMTPTLGNGADSAGEEKEQNVWRGKEQVREWRHRFPFPLGYMEETRPRDLCTKTGRRLLREWFLWEDKELWSYTTWA